MGGTARLVVPSAAYRDSYRALVAEFTARGEPLVPFPLAFPNENLEAFLAALAGCERGFGIPADFVPHSTFWLVEGAEVLGVSNLRHRLNERLRVEGGHIHRVIELLFPAVAQFRLFHMRKAARHAAPHLVDRLLVALRVLLQQNVDGDGLFVEEKLGLV